MRQWHVTARRAQGTDDEGPMPWKEAVARRRQLKTDPDVQRIEIEDQAGFVQHIWERE